MEEDLQLQIDFINQRINNMGKCFNEMKQIINNLQKEIEILKTTKSIINESNEKEIWFNIKGYEGKYQISNLLNVKSLEREFYNRKGKLYKVNEKILKQHYDKKREKFYVVLSNQNHKEKYYINKEIPTEISKNQIENCKKDFKYPKLQYIILQYDLNKKLVRKWKSFKEIEEQTTMNLSAISKCCRNKNKTHNNYYWEKVNLNDAK